MRNLGARGRRIGLSVALCLVLGASLGTASAFAGVLSASISASQQDPVVGEMVTFTATPAGASSSGATYAYVWSVDGTQVQSGPSNVLVQPFTTTGPHAVSVAVSDNADDAPGSGSLSTNVLPALGGSIAASSDTPQAGQSVTFTASVAGGRPPVSISWNLDGNAFGEASGPTATTTFATPGPRVIRAQLTDSASPAHVVVLTHPITVSAPTTGALSASISASQQDPVVGESVTYTATPSGSSSTGATYTYVWSVDGAQVQSGPSKVLVQPFTTAGPHTVSVAVSDNVGDAPGSGSLSTIVLPALGGSIAASSDAPTVGQSVTFTATVTGGRPPVSISWNLDGNAFGEALGPTATTTFATPGPRVIRAQVSDAASPAHVVVLAHSITVVAAPTATTPTPTPPPCTKRVAFGVVEITTAGCFTNVGTDAAPRWQTTAATVVNGISLPGSPPGSSFVAVPPDGAHPGGQIQLASATISLGSFTVFRGAIGWTIPAGRQGDEVTVSTLSVPAGQTFRGLKVAGSVSLRLGWAADGTHYASFPLQISLPDIFKAGPSQQSGGVSAAAAVRVDAAGIHYDGLKLQVAHAWVGRLQVESACFSFVPAGGQAVSPCAPLTLGGSPFLTCNTDVNTDRWDGNAVLILPSASQTRLGFFGSVANTQLSSLGGFADHLGTSVPIVEGVFLQRIGVGLCVVPPPFKLRGVVGVAVLPTPRGATVGIDGSFLYTDPFGANPWSVELAGDTSVFGNKLGTGTATIRPTGEIDFGLAASFGLGGVVTVDGAANGWIETHVGRFTIVGNVHACLKTLCGTASGVISSAGVAGCLGLGTLVYYVLKRNHNWHWYAPWRVHWERRTKTLETGFGHRWSEKAVHLFGSSCDLGSYSASRAQAARALAFSVPRGSQALAVDVVGATAPPQIVLHGPGGRTISSPAGGGSSQSPGNWALVENPSDNSTSVLFIRPAAGTWTVSAAPGATSLPVALSTAPVVAPAAVTAVVQALGHGRDALALAYALPEGASLTIVERGAGVERTLASAVHGRSCPGPNRPGGEHLLCARIDFVPAPGPGGRRSLIALVNRNGIPVSQQTIATFTAPTPPVPTTPRGLRMGRAGTSVSVAWTASRNAAFQTLSVVLGSGRSFGLQPGARCSSVRLNGVAAGVSVSVALAGVRAGDERTGRFARLALPAGKARAGAAGALPKHACLVG